MKTMREGRAVQLGQMVCDHDDVEKYLLPCGFVIDGTTACSKLSTKDVCCTDIFRVVCLTTCIVYAQ